jgi:hypothetical protein
MDTIRRETNQILLISYIITIISKSIILPDKNRNQMQ